jgi:hypothetical protein
MMTSKGNDLMAWPAGLGWVSDAITGSVRICGHAERGVHEGRRIDES